MPVTDLATAVGVPAASLFHPDYVVWKPRWEKLAHVYYGTGGFMDGTYLVAHPREWQDHTADTPRIPTKKLKARRALARYENIAATILDQKRSALFREGVVRTVGASEKETPHPLETWWMDVDGWGCSIDDWMADGWTAAALFGHAVHVMDRQTVDSPDTQADVPPVYLRIYTALDLVDWLQDDRGQVTAVRLIEAIPRISLNEPVREGVYRERILTQTGWALINRGTGTDPVVKRLEETPHDFGTLPVVLHYGKKRMLAPLIGQSVLGDPNLYIDLYNLTSEIRELLRAQTFGWLNMPLGTGDTAVTVEQAIAMLGNEKGAENVLFSPTPMQFIQPDTSNIEAHQNERQQLLRTIYRENAIPWEADSRDAEAEGSLKLKREDMNQVLAAYADECEKAEYAIAQLWFRAEHGENWEREFDKAKVVIRYPDTFDVTPFEDLLKQAQAAVTLELHRSPTFKLELDKRLIEKFIPDASPDIAAKIENELKAAPVETPEEKLKREQEAVVSRFQKATEKAA